MQKRLINLGERLIRHFAPELRVDKKSLRYMLWRRAVESSADFVGRHLLYAEPFETREGLYRYVMSQSPAQGLVLEFGVHNGHSINALADLTKRTVHGFDSFEGLPRDGLIPEFNDGGVKWYAGKMDNDGKLPEVRSNVSLHKGWFDETLPEFFSEHTQPIAVVHIDCDIYSSTKCALEYARKSIVAGTTIIFDEYINFEGWQRHEHRALVEFAEATGMDYEFIAYTYLGGAALKVLGFESRIGPLK